MIFVWQYTRLLAVKQWSSLTVTALLGIFGYGVFAASNLRSLTSEADIAPLVAHLDGVPLQLAIGLGKLIELDRIGIATFGFVACWIAAACFYGRKHHNWSLKFFCGLPG